MNNFFKSENLPPFIQGPAGNIEYDFFEGANNAETFKGYIAVVCHPHPLHGGTKDNKVVHTLCRAMRDIGIPCLRFNFRGIGKSEGVFDEGIGELADLFAVIAFAKNNFGEKLSFMVCGFSFGAFISAKYANKQSTDLLILVAPPVKYLEFDEINHFTCPALIVQGTQDEVVEFEKVESWVNQLESEIAFKAMDEATHFFHGRLTELKDYVQAFVLSQIEDQKGG